MVSVIIPTLNEETSLALTLQSLLAARGAFEVLVVDGQSTDATRQIAGRYCRVLQSPPGRARQMNRGAAEARGDVLLFLHADALLPASGILAVEKALAHPQMIGGNFDILYEGHRLASRIFTAINRWRRPFGIFYGDSGIFVRREVFLTLGGFRNLALMEDYDFARRMSQAGKTVCLKDSLIVSARRWEEHGLWRTLSAWFFLHAFYYLGIPERYWGWFYPPIRRRHFLSADRLDSPILRLEQPSNPVSPVSDEFPKDTATTGHSLSRGGLHRGPDSRQIDARPNPHHESQDSRQL
ncbi:MAG: TIGR04283 family arsenosugar biosynthesis glycosyltransferase [Acidobacteria bacterium]|nr:TIGR04283 family arsenosugar biosynthesis glycosyltransferase [Acidobacteriota bacterium]